MNPVNYLRISLIDRCNFRCQYCMPEAEDLTYLLQQDWLTLDEIMTLVQEVFVPLGFQHFRLTGGEPLLRPGVVDLVRSLVALPGVQDLALSTNGFYLETLALPLWEAGLRRLNISLDSLDAATFDRLTGTQGRSRWQQVWRGINTAYELGFAPLKLNVVVIPGINDHEVLDLAALSRDRPWHIRFIEFMPIGNGELFGDRGWIPSAQLRQLISDRWGLDPSTVAGAGPAEIFQIPGALGTLGFISQMSECFCDRCNRIRLSADGWLRPCLLNETGQINLKTELRQGVAPATLQAHVQQLLGLKPDINFKERFMGNHRGVYDRTMSQIGG